MTASSTSINSAQQSHGRHHLTAVVSILVYAAVMASASVALGYKSLDHLPLTIITSATLLGLSFMMTLSAMVKLSRVSVWNFHAQIIPLWLILTSAGVIIVLVFRLDYSSLFLLINWVMGLVILLFASRNIRHKGQSLYAVMPKVDLGLLAKSNIIALTGFEMPDRSVDAVIATKDEIADAQYAPVLTQLAINKIPVLTDEFFREQITGRVDHRHVDAADLMQLRPYRRYMLIKRISDVVMAASGLILLSPLMVIIAVLIKLESRGPVIFIQRRVGEAGREFQMLKFRSMVQNAEAEGARFATASDSRITALGRVIRKLRIDELPQLLNVLAGTMSMIGPRPEQKAFVDNLSQEIPLYPVRHAVRPGITGWAQVMQGYADDVSSTDVKLSYDLFYIKNLSIMMDIVIFFKTIKTIITGFGAR